MLVKDTCIYPTLISWWLGPSWPWLLIFHLSILPWSPGSRVLHDHDFWYSIYLSYLDLLVVGSFMTMTSDISPNLAKYSLRPSGVVCQESPPTNILLKRQKYYLYYLMFQDNNIFFIKIYLSSLNLQIMHKDEMLQG